MSVLVFERDERRRAQVVKLLRQRRCEFTATDSEHEAFRTLLSRRIPNLILVGVGGREGLGVELCAELRRRCAGETHPQLVLMGALETPRQLLTAFEAGVNDWTGALQESVLDLNLVIAERIGGAGAGDALHVFRRLSPGLTGLFRCAAGPIDARVEVRQGRLGRVSLEANTRPFMRLVETEVRRPVPGLAAWLSSDPSAAGNWRKALLEWGYWDRVRLRDALAQHARHCFRVLCTFPRLAVSFEPRAVDWSEDMTFAADEVLPDTSSGAPLSFVRGRLEFLRLTPANDVRMTSVS